MISENMRQELEWFLFCHEMDIKQNPDKPELWGFFYADINPDLPLAVELSNAGFVSENPNEKNRFYLNQTGADYLRVDVKIVTPFDTPDELTAARAEIARLTAALAASEAARKVADAGWSECIDVNEELRLEITLLKTDSGIPF